MVFGRFVTSSRSAQLDVIDMPESGELMFPSVFEDDVSESTESPSVSPGLSFSEVMYFSYVEMMDNLV